MSSNTGNRASTFVKLLSREACSRAKQAGHCVPDFRFVDLPGTADGRDFSLRYTHNDMGTVVDLVDNEREVVVATITYAASSRQVWFDEPGTLNDASKWSKCTECFGEFLKEHVESYCTGCGNDRLVGLDDWNNLVESGEIEGEKI
jgi:hypothetical protein